MRGLPSLVLIVIIGLMASCGEGSGVLAPMASPSPATPSPSASLLPPVVLPLPGLGDDPELGPDAPLIELLSRALEADIAGWWRLDGRLINAGGAAARGVTVIVRLYDSQGLLIDTRPAVVAPQTLLPGNTGHYGLIWPPDPRLALVTIQPMWGALPGN